MDWISNHPAGLFGKLHGPYCNKKKFILFLAPLPPPHFYLKPHSLNPAILYPTTNHQV